MVLSTCKPVTSFCIQVSDVIPAFFLSVTMQTQALQDKLNQLYHSTGSLVNQLNKSFKCASHVFIKESCLIFEKLYVWKVLKMLPWQFWRSHWDVQMDPSAGVNKTCDLRRAGYWSPAGLLGATVNPKQQWKPLLSFTLFLSTTPSPMCFWCCFWTKSIFGSGLCNAGKL